MIAMIAIFRNEEHILQEWIEHHLWFGITKFYLTDNASTDNSVKVLQPYIDAGIVELRFDSQVRNTGEYRDDVRGRFVSTHLHEAFPQQRCYMEVTPTVKEPWAIICDVDEFFYVQDRTRTLAGIINELEQKGINQIILPLKNFGSGGIIKQPSSVRKAFTVRNTAQQKPHYTPAIHKSLFKVSEWKQSSITVQCLKTGVTVDPTLTRTTDWFTNNKYFSTTRVYKENGEEVVLDQGVRQYREVEDDFFTTALICGNHYMLQSKEWFFNVKATRGVCTYANSGETETMKQFFIRRWNTIENAPSIEDYTLINILKEEGIYDEA